MPSVLVVVRRRVRLVLALVFAFAAYWCLRIAYADFLARQDSADSVEEALRLTPGNADLHARLAELESSRQPAEWEAAVEANPYHAAARIELGLLAERKGNLELAERHLTEAAQLDRTYVPSWTLANFYFRRGDESNFWIWARNAARMSHGDPTALYRLCWRVTDDADLILDRAVPGDAESLVRYLLFLMEEDHLEAGIEVARLIMPMAGEQYLGMLVGLTETLIVHRDYRRALESWNEIIEHGLLLYPPLDSAAGLSLTNGEFAAAPLGRGFDWRPLSPDGILVEYEPGGLRISMNGHQDERVALLLQYLPLEASRAYRLWASWSPEAPTIGEGINWHAADLETEAELRLEGEPPVLYTAPGTQFAKLSLRYERPQGAVPWRGEVFLRSVRLEKVSEDRKAAPDR